MNPLLTEIQNDISGLAALRDWLGDTGEPVHSMVAEIRARPCVEGNDGKPCPMNKAPRWWNLPQNVKNLAARWIRKELELKGHMRLAVPQEKRLHMCKACGCCLRLKVWVPRLLIREHTTPKVIDQTPSYCWLRRELADIISP